ncbi:MAG TPA: filamentous hemagglutinin N-terminal domain-containing protein [Alphaproteobacteria bacterium]|nr:filamentous hemagglutinin N-terminal domain-containing protein [Alphaproteobacteria bacterium]
MKRAVATLWLLASSALALPQGGSVASGGSTFTQPNASTLNITQSTNSAVLNWTGFDIAAGERVNFYQPGSNALSINRISGNASQIDGQISANGRVWLLNPNGVMFGQGARVDVGGLLTSTGTLLEDGTLGGITGGTITNNGVINASQYAALVGATVTNNGTITSPKITLAAAPAFSLDESGLISIAPGVADFSQRVANNGQLHSAGGNIQLMTQAGLASVINNTGIIEANGVTTNGGTIKLTGGVVNVDTGSKITANGGTNGNGGTVDVIGTYTRMAGTIEARGGSASGNGGKVEVSGHQGMSLPGTVITTAANGKTGTLLIDPANITITNGGPDTDDAESIDGSVLAADGGGTDFSISEQALEALSAGTNILLEATNDITIAPLTDHVLNLATTGSVVFTADSDNDGSGNFSMNALDSIVTGGAAVTINGAHINVGSIDTSAGTGAILLNTTTGSGNVTVGNALTSTNAAITLNGNLLLPNDVALTSAGGAITLNGSATGAYVLALTAGSGAISLRNVDVGTLTLASAGGLTLNGSLLADNALNFGNAGAITLAGNSTITADNGSTRQNVTLGSGNTINGNYSLAITGAVVNVGGAVGGNSALTTFTTDANSTLSLAAANTSGAQNHTGTGGITLNGNLGTNGGAVNLNNNVTLGSNVQVASTGGNITAAGTVNGAHDLTLNAGGGAVALNDTVGNSARLTTLTATGGALTLNGVQTTGAQTYTGPATINGTFAHNTGNTSFANAVTLAGNTTFNTSAGNGNTSFNSTVDGPYSLTMTGGTGTNTFTGAVGGGTPLASFASTGTNSLHNVTTSGAQSFAGNTTLNGIYTAGTTLGLTGNTTLAANSTLTGGGAAGNDITLGGTVTGAHILTVQAGGADIYFNTFSAPTLALASGNNVFINTSLASANGLDFTNLGALSLQTNATVDAGTGNLITDSANTIAGNAHNLTATGNAITLNGINNVAALNVNGTSVALNGAVDTTGAINVTGATALNNNVASTGGNITFNNAVTLGANSTIATGGGNLVTHGTLNGAYDLTITAGSGNLTADAAWGGLTPLQSLTATAAALNLNNVTTTGNLSLTGSTIANQQLVAGGNLTINGPLTIYSNLTSNQAISLNGVITMAGNSTITGGGNVGNDITLTGSVTGPYNLTLVAGLANLNLTGNVNINELTFASGSQLNYGGGTLRTAGNFSFGNVGTIYLGGDTTIHAGAGASGRADVIANSTNNILASAPGVDLSVYGDTVTFYQLGDTGSGRLNTLSIDANIVQLLGNVYTLGAQTINAQQGLAGLLVSHGGDITLNTQSQLIADVQILTDGGNVYFNQAIGGNHNLLVDAGSGSIYVNAELGGAVPLASFQAEGARIYLSSGITTQGNLTINVPVTLAANGSFNTQGGAFVLNSQLDGAHSLTINTRGGDIDLVYGANVGTYTQSSPAGAVNWGGMGLVVDGDVTAVQNRTLSGKLTSGGHATLQASQGVNLDLDVHSIAYSGGPARFTGSVAGHMGRTGAQRFGFGPVVAGPLHFNNYAVPLAEIYQTPLLPSFNLPRFNGPLFDVKLPPEALGDNTLSLNQ